jgi:hypothetical protein
MLQSYLSGTQLLVNVALANTYRNNGEVMRSLYKWLFILSMPGALWAAFEMYGLTLHGSQMLFFSISHTMPFIVLLVMMAFPLFTLWTLITATALLIEPLRKKVGIGIVEIGVLLGAQFTHILLLVMYESWSSSSLRILLCIVGWVAVIVWSLMAANWILGSQRSSVSP